MEPPRRGLSKFFVSMEDAKRAPSGFGYPWGGGGNEARQRPRAASSRNQAATACSSRLASRRRAARAALALTELGSGTVGRGVATIGARRGVKRGADDPSKAESMSRATLSPQDGWDKNK